MLGAVQGEMMTTPQTTADTMICICYKVNASTFLTTKNYFMSYNYYDNEAGQQTITTKKLSDLIAYIENFPANGDSEGTVNDGDEPILTYKSIDGKLYWMAANH